MEMIYQNPRLGCYFCDWCFCVFEDYEGIYDEKMW